MKLAQLHSTVGVLYSQPFCFTFPRSSFRVNINEAFHKNFSTWNFLFQPVHRLSIAISRIFTRNFQTISCSFVYSIPSYFAVTLLFSNQRNIDIHRLKHFGTWPTTNPSFTTATAFLSSTFCGSLLRTRHSSITGVPINFLSFCQPFFYSLRTALPQFEKLTFMWWMSSDFSTINRNTTYRTSVDFLDTSCYYCKFLCFGKEHFRMHVIVLK